VQIFNQAGRNESCCGEGTYGFHPNGTKVTVTAEVCIQGWVNFGTSGLVGLEDPSLGERTAREEAQILTIVDLHGALCVISTLQVARILGAQVS
jgi:hypothetical protein